MPTILQRFARWLLAKSAPSALAGPQWFGPTAIDAFRRQRPPTPAELLGELKNTAWTCASISAAVCASFPPRLYVSTAGGQAPPRARTRGLDADTSAGLRDAPHLTLHTQKARTIEEVVEHPLLSLLRRANPVHNSFDLWELTELYLEVQGSTYWLLDVDPVLGRPAQIWILPSQNVTPRRRSDSRNLVDVYEYRRRGLEEFPAQRVIHFRFPDPRDPYASGLRPLPACYEQVPLVSEFAAMKRSIYHNSGVPSVVLTPGENTGEEERARLQQPWQGQFCPSAPRTGPAAGP